MSYVRNNRHRRGSVLLMVIGLLTVIAMLGGTFLLVAFLDDTQATMIERQAQAEPIARGVARQAMARLFEDLHINGGAEPYGNLANSPDDWVRYIDYPGPASDPWLSESWSADKDSVSPAPTAWRWLGALVTDPALQESDLQNISPTTNSAWYVDTDGDSYIDPNNSNASRIRKDAILIDAGVTDPKGRKFYVAVRFIDTSSLVNVNTGVGSKDLTAITSPCNINLSSIVGGWVWGNLSRDRCGGTEEQDINKFWLGMGRRVPQPLLSARPYSPYSVGENIYLRYQALNSKATLSVNSQRPAPGRLTSWLESRYFIGYPTSRDPNLDELASARNIKRLLTATSTSRALVRHPSGITHKILLSQANGLTLSATNALDDTGNRQYLFDELRRAGAPEYQAAHFVANLWAYCSPHDPTTEPFDFSPTGPYSSKNYRVFGVVEQLVISEAYAYSVAEIKADGTPGENGYAYAIELFNPTHQPVDCTNYLVKVGSAKYEFTSEGAKNKIIQPGQRIVLWTVGGKIPSGANWKNATPGDFKFSTTSNDWREATCLEGLRKSIPIRVYRRVTRPGPGGGPGGTSYEIPVDSVQGDEFGYDIQNRISNDKPTIPGIHVVCRDGLREDSWDDEWKASNRYNAYTGGRGRTTIPVYLERTLADNKKDTHRLGGGSGGGNGNIANDPAFADVFEGFFIHRARGVPYDKGEFGWVFVVGPRTPDSGSSSSDVDICHELLPFKQDLSRGRLNFRGSVNMASRPNGQQYMYPDVPWGLIPAEMIELLPTDDLLADDPEHTRIYGKMNINTAGRDALLYLPWPQYISLGGARYEREYPWENKSGNVYEVDKVIDYIFAYRDRRKTSDGKKDYSTQRQGNAQSGIADLRANAASNVGGFMTPAEVTIPIGDYLHTLIGWTDYGSMPPGVLNVVRTAAYSYRGRDEIYRGISNLISVNSDTYAVLILVQLGKADDPEGVLQTWRYIAVIDRSNCRAPTDTPSLLMFARMH